MFPCGPGIKIPFASRISLVNSHKPQSPVYTLQKAAVLYHRDIISWKERWSGGRETLSEGSSRPVRAGRVNSHIFSVGAQLHGGIALTDVSRLPLALALLHLIAEYLDFE